MTSQDCTNSITDFAAAGADFSLRLPNRIRLFRLLTHH
jgi:hypothetical protein